MSLLATDSGIAVGLKAGHVVTRRAKKIRPSQRKGKLSQRVKMIREVIREVVGFAPYERRMIELLKGGGNNPQKRAWRFAKKRLGTHIRAKRKVAEMALVIDKQARVGPRPSAAVAAKKAPVKKDKKKTASKGKAAAGKGKEKAKKDGATPMQTEK